MAPRANIPFPTKDDILAYVKDNPGKISKRDIARAFIFAVISGSFSNNCSVR